MFKILGQKQSVGDKRLRSQQEYQSLLEDKLTSSSLYCYRLGALSAKHVPNNDLNSDAIFYYKIF